LYGEFTDQKLYIARCIEQKDMDKADFSGSTTLNHWAVVIHDGGRYYYTQAVGNVVSGKGKPIPFREMEEDRLNKYRLNPVGFVTQKQRETKTRELVDAKPMVSGNSCQEYAVVIAFQLSSSRTYTFVKIMALPRMRNTVFYSAVIAQAYRKHICAGLCPQGLSALRFKNQRGFPLTRCMVHATCCLS
jgi:hypothetical protein